MAPIQLGHRFSRQVLWRAVPDDVFLISPFHIANIPNHRPYSNRKPARGGIERRRIFLDARSGTSSLPRPGDVLLKNLHQVLCLGSVYRRIGPLLSCVTMYLPQGHTSNFALAMEGAKLPGVCGGNGKGPPNLLIARAFLFIYGRCRVCQLAN